MVRFQWMIQDLKTRCVLINVARVFIKKKELNSGKIKGAPHALDSCYSVVFGGLSIA